MRNEAATASPSMESAANADLRERWDERAAILEHGAGLPLRWADALAWIYVMPPPPGVWPDRWARIRAGAAWLIEDHGRAIIAARWRPEALLGVKTFGDAPTAGVLLWRLDYLRVLSVDASGGLELRGAGVWFVMPAA